MSDGKGVQGRRIQYVVFDEIATWDAQILERIPELNPPTTTRVAATHEEARELRLVECVYCDAEQTHWVCAACFDRLPR